MEAEVFIFDAALFFADSGDDVSFDVIAVIADIADDDVVPEFAFNRSFTEAEGEEEEEEF